MCVGLVTVALRMTAATPLAGTPPRPTPWTSIVWPPAMRPAGPPTPVRVSSRRAGGSGRKNHTQADGMTGFEAAECDAPIPFVAVTVKVYEVLLVRPFTTALVVDPLTVAVWGPGVAVTV